jgi:hypothetical protein
VLIHGVDRSPYLMQLTAPYGAHNEDALQAKIADMRTTERIMEPTDRVRKLSYGKVKLKCTLVQALR